MLSKQVKNSFINTCKCFFGSSIERSINRIHSNEINLIARSSIFYASTIQLKYVIDLKDNIIHDFKIKSDIFTQSSIESITEKIKNKNINELVNTDYHSFVDSVNLLADNNHRNKFIHSCLIVDSAKVAHNYFLENKNLIFPKNQHLIQK